MTGFVMVTVVGMGLVTGTVALRRGRRLAQGVAAVLLVHAMLTVSLLTLAAGFAPLFGVLQVLVYLEVAVLITGLPRPRLWSPLVSWPASTFMAGSFLALPWALVAIGPWDPPGLWLPYGLAAVGLFQSVTTRKQTVSLDLSRSTEGPVLAPHPAMQQRRRGLPREAPADHADRPLRVVQLTDTHLGPFMSEARLRRICARAVAAHPDLIVLTGDLLTVASQGSSEPLARALAPLRAHPRVYACLGNHDHESLPVVAEALAAAGVVLLVDRAVVARTPVGPVQVVGLDFRWRDRAAHVAGVLRGVGRPVNGDGETIPRIVLLHDPGAFTHCPDGEADLVFSGHTHGGQLGLVSFGLDWTVVRAFSVIPDHGPWAQGRNRLYVHRATGHYGFPLRVGVPAEESVLEVRFAGAGAQA